MALTSTILERLRENTGSNLRAIEELTKFQSNLKIFTVHETNPELFSYLLISGHPSTIGRTPTVILGGNVDSANELTKHLPSGPYTILETRADFLRILEGKIPKSATVYNERRMELVRANYKPISASKARPVVLSDDVALAKFNGAPPQAAAGMRNWISGAAAIYAIFEGTDIISMGSTFCAVPDGWSLVGIKTKEEHRRKGLGGEVTSALCSKAFENKNVNAVQLTVLSDNAPAISLYEKLGFELKEGRVWIDCGSGSKPF